MTYLYASYQKYADYIRLEENKILELIRRSRLRELEDDQKLKLDNGGFIYKGGITKCIGADDNEGSVVKYDSFSIVPPSNFEFITTRKTKILDFDEIAREIMIVGGNERRGSFNDRGHSGRYDNLRKVSFREAYN